MERQSSGSEALDKFLGGGYEKKVVTTIYGPGASGKTLLLMLAMTKADKKIIYIDTEGGFSPERFEQVCSDKKVMESTTFLNPTNFKEQKEAIEQLKNLSKLDISLIIVDTLTSLYRVEMSGDDNYDLNKELAKQMRDLVQLARKRNIPVLVAGQVYADMKEKDKVNVVGGIIMKNMSKCLLEVQKVDDKRKVIIRKHRSMREGREFNFKIVQKGIE
ncbi:DNA repair and recombination protein RadB [Nanoarchaeota archaeon]